MAYRDRYLPYSLTDLRRDAPLDEQTVGARRSIGKGQDCPATLQSQFTKPLVLSVAKESENMKRRCDSFVTCL